MVRQRSRLCGEESIGVVVQIGLSLYRKKNRSFLLPVNPDSGVRLSSDSPLPYSRERGEVKKVRKTN